jgi:hypothetical protein
LHLKIQQERDALIVPKRGTKWEKTEGMTGREEAQKGLKKNFDARKVLAQRCLPSFAHAVKKIFERSGHFATYYKWTWTSVVHHNKQQTTKLERK